MEPKWALKRLQTGHKRLPLFMLQKFSSQRRQRRIDVCLRSRSKEQQSVNTSLSSFLMRVLFMGSSFLYQFGQDEALASMKDMTFC